MSEPNKPWTTDRVQDVVQRAKAGDVAPMASLCETLQTEELRLRIEMLPRSELRASPFNLRVPSAPTPILVRGGEIVSGHLRAKSATEMGVPFEPCEIDYASSLPIELRGLEARNESNGPLEPGKLFLAHGQANVAENGVYVTGEGVWHRFGSEDQPIVVDIIPERSWCDQFLGELTPRGRAQFAKVARGAYHTRRREERAIRRITRPDRPRRHRR